jgi:hypothetical protein
MSLKPQKHVGLRLLVAVLMIHIAPLLLIGVFVVLVDRAIIYSPKPPFLFRMEFDKSAYAEFVASGLLFFSLLMWGALYRSWSSHVRKKLNISVDYKLD